MTVSMKSWGETSSMVCLLVAALNLVAARCERQRGVADDAIALAGGVARVAQVQQARREAVTARGEQCAVDGRRAAGLVQRHIGVELQDALHGGAVQRLRLLVGVVVR